MPNGEDFIERDLINYRAETKDGEMIVKALMHFSSKFSNLPCKTIWEEVVSLKKRNASYVSYAIMGILMAILSLVLALFGVYGKIGF